MKSNVNIPGFLSKVGLGIVMLSIGAFTLFAGANTFEVIAKQDAPLSTVIKPITVTKDSAFNILLIKKSTETYATGSFGVPQKIKLSESRQHLEITPAQAKHDQWLASQGLAQFFITAEPRQKVFGEAFIYLRYNTSTTQYLGDVLTGDVINIVTTEGWQLGYQVQQTATDPSLINTQQMNDTSTIHVTLVDDTTQKIKTFSGTLIKVGERL